MGGGLSDDTTSDALCCETVVGGQKFVARLGNDNSVGGLRGVILAGDFDVWFDRKDHARSKFNVTVRVDRQMFVSAEPNAVANATWVCPLQRS